MSLLDELKKEAAKSSMLAEKRAQIEALRTKAQTAFKEQFLLDAANKEQIAFLKGRIAAFEECLQLFTSDAEQGKEQNRRKWDEDED
jgi:hypothetical protein